MACALALGVPAAHAAKSAQVPVQYPNNQVIDGPDPGITSLNGMSIARDGTGGLVYVKDQHIFVSRLLSGAFQLPQQVDTGLSGPSTQPVIAADSGGELIVAFINSGSLYEVSAPSSAQPLSAPALLFVGAINPSLSMSTFGKAYIAFTAPEPDGSDEILAAYDSGSQWALDTTPINVSPSDAAGVGSGRPDVATAGDGIAIVAWGESGHVYTRRLIGTTPSVVYQQADPPSADGWSELSAGDPEVSTGGDSTYASVAFLETLTNGPAQQQRAYVSRLLSGAYVQTAAVDGEVTGGAEGADNVQTVSGEYGAGWVTAEAQQSHQLIGTLLFDNEKPGPFQLINGTPDAAAPDAAPATAGPAATFIAWQQTPGITGPAEIRVRYAGDGEDLGPEQIVSSPTLGPTDADAGLVTGGDQAGDAAIAWVQSGYIVTARLFQPPGNLAPAYAFQYERTAQPALAWSASPENWGPVQYTVSIDGQPQPATFGTSWTPPAPLANGRHSYRVVASNAAGQTATARTAAVFVDTVRPKLTLRVTGKRYVGVAQHLKVTAVDLPPAGEPASDASGVAGVTIRWTPKLAPIAGRSATHTFTRRGTYKLTVTASDRAGNLTVATRTLTITVKPKPKQKCTKTKQGKRVCRVVKPKPGKPSKGKGASAARRADGRRR